MKAYFESEMLLIFHGDCREVLSSLPDESVQCCVTSPPYWGLRDYGVTGQLGLERTPDEYISEMVEVFREVKRVLKSDGTLWLNMGDSYATGTTAGRQLGTLDFGEGTMQARQISRIGTPAGMKTKDLCGIPWMLAFALRADGWYLRSDIIWHKPNPMPESVTDRPTKSHEYIFLLSKSERYFYDHEAIKEASISGDPRKPYAPGQVDKRGNGHDRNGGEIRSTIKRDGIDRGDDARGRKVKCGIRFEDYRNKRSVWTVATSPFPEAHFATFPEDLIKPCILAGCPAGGTVLDPFYGAGTTGLVARAHGCKVIGIELSEEYLQIAAKRLSQEVFAFEASV